MKFLSYTISRIRIFIGAFIRDSRELSARYPQYRIGRGSYGPLEIETFGDTGTVSIGAFCSFAKGVCVLLGGEHRSNWITTYPFDRKYFFASGAPHSTYSRGDVVVGNDVWVGRGALILSGARIGNGAIIGAHALVRGDIPPYAIAVGNPARVVRYRFEAHVIQKLEKIEWWNWDDERIRDQLPRLMAEPMDDVVKD